MKRTLKTSSTLVLAALALGLSACAQTPTPIAFAEQQKPLILRCTMRPEGPIILSSNTLTIAETIRAGTAARVDMFSPQRVDLTLNNIAYQMRPVTLPFAPSPEAFLKKYFVKAPGELGLEKLEAARKRNIESGLAEVGMTKEQVYTALGPPLYVDFEHDASHMTYEAIMDKNRWVYRGSYFGPFTTGTRVYMFDEGKLRQTIP